MCEYCVNNVSTFCIIQKDRNAWQAHRVGMGTVILAVENKHF